MRLVLMGLGGFMFIGVIAGGFFWYRQGQQHAMEPTAISTAIIQSYATNTVDIATTSLSATSSVGTTSSVIVPILVYHIVRPSLPTDSAAVRASAVTPATFAAELKYLKDAGYQVIGFQALEDHFASSTSLPKKPIILSFDDGWSDQYTYAFPILKQYGDVATFFVFTNGIGHKGFLTWANLQEFLKAGMTIGDHTQSHPYLLQITDPQKLWNEVDGSKQLLERKLHIKITEFAYPFGQHDPQLIKLVRQAGYRSARGDYWNGWRVSTSTLYTLSALNAPITLTQFKQHFP